MLSASSRLTLGYTATLLHGVLHAARLREPAVRASLARQIQLSGVQALPAVGLVAALLGAVVPTQAMALLGPDNETVLKLLVWGGIRELAPLLSALVLIARSGVAIATEVALMHLRGGMDDTLWHGAAHEDEVVIPRMLGLAISGAVLASYFQAIAIVAALLASSLLLDTPLLAELDAFLGAGAWWQVMASIAKSALFGLAIGAVCCYHGLNAEPRIAAIPKAAVAAGLGSLMIVLAIDLFAAWLRIV
jgi:phospholipid/cholesterol/gamma-HCH transport system permease protein